MNILTFIFVLMFTSSIFSQALKQPVSHELLNYSHFANSNTPGNNILTDNPVIDTTGTIPGLTQYWDYVSNGNNLRKLWVLGDTVIVAADYTDSINASVPTARKTYYQVSYNGGVSWEFGYQPILINNSTTAYPDLALLIISGSRTLGLSGLGGAYGAYIGVDVVLGAGSFTLYNAGPIGPQTPAVCCALSNVNVGYVYSKSDTLFYRTINCQTGVYSSAVVISILQPNARYYITSSSNGNNVFVMWWNSSPNELKARESTNGGNTFGAVMTVCPPSVNINGETVTPWYAADVVYKPGTTTLYAAFSTLAPGNFPTAQGSKVLMWSPAVNGGQPVKICDWKTISNILISDTSNFNSNLRQIQVGMTPVSHPSIAFSSNADRIVCAFSSALKDTSFYGFHFNRIFCSYSDSGGRVWSNASTIGCVIPGYVLVTDKDEIYPTVSKTGNTTAVFNITYSVSNYPGSCSFTNTNTPKGRVYQIFRKHCPTGAGGGAVTTISTEIPKAFSLEQNYPNPFNPKTIIRFDILKASDVKITVFDITGKEVTRLVQQKLNAGKYSVDFEAENLASGIYFYSITAGDFVQTKKMILVK